MSKGSKRRPTLISRKEHDLRWALFTGGITSEEFDKYKRLEELENEQEEFRDGRKKI